MTIVNFGGTFVRAEKLRQNDDGSWVMKALSSHPRFDVGHEFVAQPSEIVESDRAQR